MCLSDKIDYNKNPMEDEVYSIQDVGQCIEHGTYKEFNYYIISYGSHPCCYIEIPKNHKYCNSNYDVINEFSGIECHGGLTYSHDSLGKLTDSWFIGFDYAHLGDFSMKDYKNFGDDSGCKYSLDGLRRDVYHAIDTL